MQQLVNCVRKNPAVRQVHKIGCNYQSVVLVKSHLHLFLQAVCSLSSLGVCVADRADLHCREQLLLFHTLPD